MAASPPLPPLVAPASILSLYVEEPHTPEEALEEARDRIALAKEGCALSLNALDASDETFAQIEIPDVLIHQTIWLDLGSNNLTRMPENVQKLKNVTCISIKENNGLEKMSRAALMKIFPNLSLDRNAIQRRPS